MLFIVTKVTVRHTGYDDEESPIPSLFINVIWPSVITLNGQDQLPLLVPTDIVSRHGQLNYLLSSLSSSLLFLLSSSPPLPSPLSHPPLSSSLPTLLSSPHSSPPLSSPFPSLISSPLFSFSLLSIFLIILLIILSCVL